ncbi:hypothetical protein H2200_010491 [Cladophialophora chaetospira]|uniref:Uncharacterized protein n=1 Tax=Cladophialophora chaetospira TaxID=386627 RepID=A0AA38X1J2_9EURO|nr:hypothetical protein H2200_010491 [Cladophialophora chaetospira]
MPPGGRPPRGRPGRNNDRLWELQQQRAWDYDARVEELDTDDDNSPQGVELEQNYGQPRYRSDELRFTGIDLGGGMVRRRRSGDAHEDNFTPSEDEEEYEYDVQTGVIRRQDMQVAYRDKEELLVQRALERISRARALGKPNVKLSRAEIDALDRLERNQNPPRPSAAPKAAPKGKKEAPVVKRKPVEVRKNTGKGNARSASDSPTKGKSRELRGRGQSNAFSSSARASRDNSVTAYALPPPEVDYDRRAPYPQGYFLTGAHQMDPASRGSRTNSNQSLRQQAMPPPQHPYYTNRYSSNPDVLYGNRPGSGSSRSSRPDPAEMDWEPRARSTSNLINMPLDQIPYQSGVGRAPRFDPSDPRFASPQRRVASGPPTMQTQAVQYRRPQDELFLPEGQPEVYNYLTGDDEEDENNEDDDDDDSDYNAGVEVNVSERPGGNYAIQTRSATAAAAPRAKGNGKGTGGKSKKGR